MESRSKTARCSGLFVLLALVAAPLGAQVETVQRIAGMVAIAADEYGKALDAQGKLVSNEEYQEAAGFLSEAKTSAGRLPAERRGAGAILDSLIAAVNAKRPVVEIKALASRFASALGSGAALDLPRLPLDPDSGGRIYASTCAACHGARGMGDGPSAKGMNPAPPAIGSLSSLGRCVSKACKACGPPVELPMAITSGMATPGWRSTIGSFGAWLSLIAPGAGLALGSRRASVPGGAGRGRSAPSWSRRAPASALTLATSSSLKACVPLMALVEVGLAT